MRERALKRTSLLLALLCLCAARCWAEGIVVIAHPSVPKTDLATLQRIYTGKVIEINGVSIVPINAPPGSFERNRFLRDFLQQDEEKYTAYWTVRRYIGKGSPPREVASADMAVAVQSTPGAIGYLPDSELRPGMAILMRR